MMDKRIVIVGTSPNSRIARFYFEKDLGYKVVAYTVNSKYLSDSSYDNRPVVPIENVSEIYPPANHKAFVAVGYAGMNRVRESLYFQMKSLGYQLPNYISPRCSYLTEEEIGDNNFILEDNTIQPFVKIGSNNVIWSGNHIGHDGTIGDHNFITSHVVISGFVNIKNYCFLGVNATIRDGVSVENHTLVAAGAIITKNTEEGGVYVPARTTLLDKKSGDIKI